MSMAVEQVDRARSEMEQTNRAFVDAFNAGDIERAVAAVYTEQARVIPPDAPIVQGHAAITQFWRTAAQQLDVRHVELTTDDLEVHGEVAHEQGRASLTLGEAAQQVVARYVVIWKREREQWRWHVDIWNTGT